MKRKKCILIDLHDIGSIRLAEAKCWTKIPCAWRCFKRLSLSSLTQLSIQPRYLKLTAFFYLHCYFSVQVRISVCWK